MIHLSGNRQNGEAVIPSDHPDYSTDPAGLMRLARDRDWVDDDARITVNMTEQGGRVTWHMAPTEVDVKLTPTTIRGLLWQRHAPKGSLIPDGDGEMLTYQLGFSVVARVDYWEGDLRVGLYDAGAHRIGHGLIRIPCEGDFDETAWILTAGLLRYLKERETLEEIVSMYGRWMS